MADLRTTIMMGDSPQLYSGAGTKADTAGKGEDLFEMLELEKKRKLQETKANNFESTSADSSLSNFTDEEEEKENQPKRPTELSLMLYSDPYNSMILLKYLKHYSELLFNWGETELAV